MANVLVHQKLKQTSLMHLQQMFSWTQNFTVQKLRVVGCLGGSEVERLLLAQGMILEYWDRVPHQAPCMESASPSTCVSASLSLSLINLFF